VNHNQRFHTSHSKTSPSTVNEQIVCGMEELISAWIT